jgi:hypothetical protein
MRVSQSWFIMFLDAKPSWMQAWGFMLKRGYRHVILCRYEVEVDMFLAFETWSGGGRVKLIQPYQFVQIQGICEEVLLGVTDVDPYRPMLPRLFTCVGVVKHMFGMRWPLTFTPWQLRCTLLRTGMADKYDPDYLHDGELDGDVLEAQSS